MADQLITGTTLIEKENKVNFRSTGTATWDFEVGDLTTDGNMQELDLTTMIPQGTQWVYLRIRVNDGLANQSIAIGNSNPLTEHRISTATQVADITLEETGFVEVPSNRKLHYFTSNTTFTQLSIKIIGYIKWHTILKDFQN